MVEAGKTVRKLVRVPWQGGVEPGDYEVSVSYFDSKIDAWTKSTRVKVREATAEEKTVMEKAGTVGLYANAKTGKAPAADLALPPALESAVGFNVLLRRLFTSAEPIAKIDAKDLQLASTHFFDPELRAVEYEALLAADKTEEAEKLRTQVLQKEPGLKWLFDSIKGGRGIIQRGRMLVTAPGSPAER